MILLSETGKLIQKLAHNQIQSELPTVMLFGTVETDMVNNSKVTIRIDQKRVLPEEMLIFSNIYKRNSCQKGKTVIMLRQWGGQRFLVLGGVEGDT